jgi:hypothetical protein
LAGKSLKVVGRGLFPGGLGDIGFAEEVGMGSGLIKVCLKPPPRPVLVKGVQP